MFFTVFTNKFYQRIVKGFLTVSFAAIIVSAVALTQQTHAAQPGLLTPISEQTTTNQVQNLFQNLVNIVRPVNTTPVVTQTPATTPRQETPATPVANTQKPSQPQVEQTGTQTQPSKPSTTQQRETPSQQTVTAQPTLNQSVNEGPASQTIQSSPPEIQGNLARSNPQELSQGTDRKDTVIYKSSSLSPSQTRQGYITSSAALFIGIVMVIFGKFLNNRNLLRRAIPVNTQNYTSRNFGYKG